MLDDHQATVDAVLPGPRLISEPAGQVVGRTRRHSLWTSQPSTTSTKCQDSSGINQGHQPTARAALTNRKPRIQKLLEPPDLQLITPKIKRRNPLACLKPRPEI